uniref:AN1-type domain-containing protein n=2 Tax=Culex tarsalis TaxID=7177 RepID=A0A1Q3FED0_CULTA
MTNRLKTATAAAAAAMAGECSANLLAESMFNKESSAGAAATGFASTEIAFDKGSTGSGLDKTFRTLYKSTSDDNSTYELPKLLIREDSPVESFHSSYPQLETVALRGESPKNFNSMAKLQDAGAAAAEGQSSLAPGPDEKTTKLSSGSLLQLYEHPPPATTAAIGGGASGNGGGGTWAPHYGGVGHHHHSDLGINELELKFINNGLMEKSGGSAAASSGGSVFKLPAVSNLEINHWNALSNDSVNNYARSGDGKDGKEEEQASNSRTSNGFIHSDLSISSDEDDLFSISDLIYKSQANKSKSIDLNEFRKTFGSSPTLLNNFGGTNCNLAPQLSRLDAIPSQYRRGYTNLNDAGLSCSTSELECVNATTKKKTGSGDNGELSPLLKHRNNDHVAYVRSYENLNRYKAFSMKNGESGDILRCQQGGGQLLPGISNLDSIADSDLNSSSGSGSNLIDDSFTDFEYRFSRLSCSGGGCSSTNTSSNTQTSSSGSSSSSSNQNNGATGATHRLLPLTDPNHRTRLMFGHPPAFNNTSSPFSNNNHNHLHHHHHSSSSGSGNNNNNNSASAANYYFPSDESLFNIDSFFDDFVEIDTSDIFDNTEYINLADSRSSNSSSSKVLQKSNKQSLLLPEILQQDELLLKAHPGGFSESASEDLLGVDDDEEGAAASAIRQIDADSTTERGSIERELPAYARVGPPPKPSVGGTAATATVHHHPAEPLKSKKLRCAHCNRKLGVIMVFMKCHCEKIFCAQHRYAEAHNCSYDFKLEGKKLLERENPLVVAQKLPKI